MIKITKGKVLTRRHAGDYPFLKSETWKKAVDLSGGFKGITPYDSLAVKVKRAIKESGYGDGKVLSSPVEFPMHIQRHINQLDDTSLSTKARRDSILYLGGRDRDGYTPRIIEVLAYEGLSDGDVGVRRATEVALEKMGATERQIFDGYSHAIDSDYVDAREDAVGELGKMQDEALKRETIELLTDKGLVDRDEYVRRYAMEVLTNLGITQERLVRGFTNALFSDVWGVSDDAKAMLYSLGIEDEWQIDLQNKALLDDPELISLKFLKISENLKDDLPELFKFNQSSSPIIDSEDVGGIDMNRIEVDRQGVGVQIEFDPVEIQQIMDRGIDGFTPVIINIVPLPSVLPLLGLEPKRREDEEWALSSLN